MTKQKAKSFASRREALRLLGVAGATALVGWAGEPLARWLPPAKGSRVAQAGSFALPQQACVVKPALTEGPYFVDEKLNRSDIRTDPATGAVSTGVLLVLQFNVTRTADGNCAPLSGVYVDVWHANAAGNYSDIAGGAGQPNTSGHKFLRGYQVTDASGAAQFQTIYPGWYPGRTAHIHFKIRLFADSQTAYEFTSQLFFDDSLTDQVYALAPYNAEGTRDTRNSNDNIYSNGGSQLLLSLIPTAQGYTTTFDIALEGVPADVTVPMAAPEITGAEVSGKQLIVSGQNFSAGAKIFLNGAKQKKTANDATSPTTRLIAKKAGKQISAGQTVTLHVKNSDDSLSNEYPYTRPLA